MIQTITSNLHRIRQLTDLPEEDFCDSSTGPYYSSIGGHVRHLLDIFTCITCGIENKHIDFTQRCRDSHCESNTCAAEAYVDDIIEQLTILQGLEMSLQVILVDDLGEGKIATPATFGSVLMQAHNHAIHHFAIIGYLLHIRGISLPDTAFGYNPTTPIVPVNGSHKNIAMNAEAVNTEAMLNT